MKVVTSSPLYLSLKVCLLWVQSIVDASYPQLYEWIWNLISLNRRKIPNKAGLSNKKAKFLEVTF